MWAHLAVTSPNVLTNFGDEMSPHAVALASGRRVRWAPAAEADMVAVGSILQYVAPRTKRKPLVWGSGLRNAPRAGAADAIAASLGPILAVRGPETIAHLGVTACEVGDPAVLAPQLLPRAPRRQGAVFVPHLSTWRTRATRSQLSLARRAGYDVVSPASKWTTVLRRISRADFVITSSLHGLIVAHSYGVPAQLVMPSTGPGAESKFKYVDYLESVGLAFEPATFESAIDSTAARTLIDQRAAEAEGTAERCSGIAARLVEVLRNP